VQPADVRFGSKVDICEWVFSAVQPREGTSIYVQHRSSLEACQPA
jgi:hypothetical protein